MKFTCSAVWSVCVCVTLYWSPVTAPLSRAWEIQTRQTEGKRLMGDRNTVKNEKHRHKDRTTERESQAYSTHCHTHTAEKKIRKTSYKRILRDRESRNYFSGQNLHILQQQQRCNCSVTLWTSDTSVFVARPKYNDNFCFLSHADSVCTGLHSYLHACACPSHIYSMYVCLCVRKNICFFKRVCVNHLPQTSLRLCVDHTWPYGTALWRHTVAQMDTFCAGHILNDPPVAAWTTLLINQGSLLTKRKLQRIHPLGGRES